MRVVLVKIPGADPQTVIVENAEDDTHARLAAYYYLCNLVEMQEIGKSLELEKLLEVTTILGNCHGPANAKFYKNKL